MPHVLFVCSGNRCRSPMAEGLLRGKLNPAQRARFTVSSAGTLGLEDLPATPQAIRSVLELGGADLRAHRSRGISAALVREADLILVMTGEHLEELRSAYPDSVGKVFLLKRYGRAGSSRDGPEGAAGDRIEDPFGGDLEEYRACARLLDAELERILPLLVGDR